MADLAPFGSNEELTHLRRLRDAVLEVLGDFKRTPRQKFETIQLLFLQEQDEEPEPQDEDQEEEAQDRERLS